MKDFKDIINNAKPRKRKENLWTLVQNLKYIYIDYKIISFLFNKWNSDYRIFIIKKIY
jgi:hypothetical protein